MAMDFPSNPSVNDEHIIGDRTWVWSGTRWEFKSGGSNTGGVTADETIILDAMDAY